MLHANVLALALALTAFAPSALAQATAYGQCGGTGWSGATTCVSGWTCTYSNLYYSQCLPAQSTSASSTITTSKTTTTSTTSTKTSTSTSSSPTSTAGPNYWFSFGDSYTQTGFSINGTQPALGNPLGNPAYPGYTATGSPNWIDVAATQYNHSALLAYNFAVGGSTIVWDIVGNSYGSTLESQVGNFTYWNGAAKRTWTSSDALFSFWFGINDIGNSYYLSNNQSAFNGDLIYAYFNQVQRLYNLGARNFLFLNVPPIERSPLMQAQGASATTSEARVIADFNAKLAAAASAWGANHTGARTWLYDAHSAFGTILDSPTKYGFVDNTSYGGTGDFWGNNYHPSSAASVMFGQQVGSLLNGTVW